MRTRVLITAWLLAIAPAIAQNRATNLASQMATPIDRVGTDATITTAKQPETTPATAAKTETVPIRRARLPSVPKSAASAKYKLLDEAGKQVAITAGSSDALEADIAPGKPYVLVPPGAARQAVTMSKLEFPARYLTFDKNGNPLNDGGLFLRPMSVPMVWNDQIRAYATELIVGYDFKDGHEQPLVSPKTVALFAEGSNAQIKADTVIIHRSGTSGYQRVVLATNQVDGETLFTARASPGMNSRPAPRSTASPAAWISPSRRGRSTRLAWGRRRLP